MGSLLFFTTLGLSAGGLSAAASKTLVDLSDVLKCDGGCTTEDWQHFAASGVFQGQWKSWLRPLADADGNCWEVPPVELEAVRLRFGSGSRSALPIAQLSMASEASLWSLCRPLALLFGLALLEDELQSLTASESLGLVPRFLRHFTLRLGASPKKSSALWELLKHAEARVVGAYRERLSPFRTQRCDVCCTDASCPFSTETGLCPADSQFDANQDLRDRLWPRAELILDGLEQAHQKAEVEDSFVAPVVMPFQFCERMSRRNSTLVTDVATVWNALDNSSCLPQQVADAIYCFWQQRQSFDVFSAAQTIQQAVVFQLLCNSCGPATWPLPFTFEDVWMNFYVAIRLAVNLMAFALVQVGKKTHGTEVHRRVLQLLKGKFWQDAIGTTFQRSLDFIRPLHLQGLHSCPVDLGPSWLMDGKLQVIFDAVAFLQQTHRNKISGNFQTIWGCNVLHRFSFPHLVTPEERSTLETTVPQET